MTLYLVNVMLQQTVKLVMDLNQVLLLNYVRHVQLLVIVNYVILKQLIKLRVQHVSQVKL